MEYGVEIWGWEEKTDLERIMYDYVRWMFGLEFCTKVFNIQGTGDAEIVCVSLRNKSK